MLSRIHFPVMTVLPAAGPAPAQGSGAVQKAFKTWIFAQAAFPPARLACMDQWQARPVQSRIGKAAQ
jgi:hypothetical protein